MNQKVTRLFWSDDTQGVQERDGLLANEWRVVFRKAYPLLDEPTDADQKIKRLLEMIHRSGAADH
jgi:hypothetical protein